MIRGFALANLLSLFFQLTRELQASQKKIFRDIRGAFK